MLDEIAESLYEKMQAAEREMKQLSGNAAYIEDSYNKLKEATQRWKEAKKKYEDFLANSDGVDDDDPDWSDPDADDEFLGTFYVDVSSNLHYLSPGFPADPELLDPDYKPNPDEDEYDGYCWNCGYFMGGDPDRFCPRCDDQIW